MKKILVPAAAIAGVILLVGIIVAFGNGGSDPTKPGGKGEFGPFPLDGSEWKDLPGGVKYWDVKEGNGTPIAAGASVKMHYTLWLTNGKKVQSSKDTGAPFTATLNTGNLIAGWVEGVPGMKPGGIRRLIIPPEKGYGNQNKEGIPPGSTLIFEVELPSANTP